MNIPHYLPSHCGKFESTIAYFFFQIWLIVLTMSRPTSKCFRHEVLALACEGRQQCAIAGCVSLTHATVNRILRRHAATRNFGASQVHRGASEDHTSSRPCFIEDGPTGSLHKCLGRDGADEEFVSNEGWSENHQQPALVPWLQCM